MFGSVLLQLSEALGENYSDFDLFDIENNHYLVKAKLSDDTRVFMLGKKTITSVLLLKMFEQIETLSHENLHIPIRNIILSSKIKGVESTFIQENLTTYITPTTSKLDIIKIIHKISKGLVYLSHKGLVHSNLCPDNILMLNNEPKITNFACMRIKSLLPYHICEDDVLQQAFQAPELMGKYVHERSDVWSLCMIMYYLLSGEECKEYIKSLNFKSDLAKNKVNLNFQGDPALSVIYESCLKIDASERIGIATLKTLLDACLADHH